MDIIAEFQFLDLLKKPDKNTIKTGDLVWFRGQWDGRDFGISMKISGPYLVKKVLFRPNPDARIDVVNTENGEERSLMASWLYVPKEEK
jgi:hypothetical protein